MDLEKDQFEDDDELSRLEEDEELGGETEGVIEEEEEEILTIDEEPAEEAEEEPAGAIPRAPGRHARRHSRSIQRDQRTGAEVERLEIEQGEPGDDLEDLHGRRGTRSAAGAPHNEKQNADEARCEHPSSQELSTQDERRPGERNAKKRA